MRDGAWIPEPGRGGASHDNPPQGESTLNPQVVVITTDSHEISDAIGPFGSYAEAEAWADENVPDYLGRDCFTVTPPASAKWDEGEE